MRRLFHPARCDCLSCFGYRLARDFLVAGLAAVLLISALVAPDESDRLLIEDTTASGGGAW